MRSLSELPRKFSADPGRRSGNQRVTTVQIHFWMITASLEIPVRAAPAFANVRAANHRAKDFPSEPSQDVSRDTQQPRTSGESDGSIPVARSPADESMKAFLTGLFGRADHREKFRV